MSTPAQKFSTKAIKATAAEADSGSASPGGLNDEDASADPSATLALTYGKARKNDVHCHRY